MQLTRIAPCNVWSPHEPGRVRVGRGEKSVPVQCNRPQKHAGNHMCLNVGRDCLAEWEPAIIIR